MNKILQLLVDDFLDRKVNDEYKSLQKKVSEIERPFIDSLSDEQLKKYFEIESLISELQIKSLNELAEFLFENIKKFNGGENA